MRYTIPVAVGAAILAIGIGFAANQIAGALTIDKKTIYVTGSAKKKITSNVGSIRLTVSSRGINNEEVYRNGEKDREAVVKYMASKGFDAAGMKRSGYYRNAVYRRDARNMETTDLLYFTTEQMLDYQSDNVTKIADIANQANEMALLGLSVRVDQPQYFYTKLGDLKISMQADASRDAKARAEQIANSVGSHLGSLIYADMGVIQITPVNSTQVSDYGVLDNSSIDKEITAVVSARFLVE